MPVVFAPWVMPVISGVAGFIGSAFASYYLFGFSDVIDSMTGLVLAGGLVASIYAVMDAGFLRLIVEGMK